MTTRYYFYNAHGSRTGTDPAKALSDSRDGETMTFAVDWTPENEAARDALIQSLGIGGISALPCVVYFEPAHEEDDGEGGRIMVPDRYVEYRIADMPKRDWTWTKVDGAIATRQSSRTVTVSR